MLTPAIIRKLQKLSENSPQARQQFTIIVSFWVLFCLYKEKNIILSLLLPVYNKLLDTAKHFLQKSTSLVGNASALFNLKDKEILNTMFNGCTIEILIFFFMLSNCPTEKEHENKQNPLSLIKTVSAPLAKIDFQKFLLFMVMLSNIAFVAGEGFIPDNFLSPQ